MCLGAKKLTHQKQQNVHRGNIILGQSSRLGACVISRLASSFHVERGKS